MAIGEAIAEQERSGKDDEEEEEEEERRRGRETPGTSALAQLLAHSSDHLAPLHPLHLLEFQNLTELLVRVLPAIDKRYFLAWFPNYASAFNRIATRFPLASGAYRLMAIAFRTLDEETRRRGVRFCVSGTQ